MQLLPIFGAHAKAVMTSLILLFCFSSRRLSKNCVSLVRQKPVGTPLPILKLDGQEFFLFFDSQELKHIRI